MREPPFLRSIPALAALGLLAGCSGTVLDPGGDVALQQRNLIYASTGLMLLIIVPVMTLIVVFAWRYRRGNTDATYDPKFDHSTSLELIIWSAPLAIIIALGALTWSSTHLLDPFRPLGRISATKPIDKAQPPMLVQVVALDWKWLFIYPELGIATVNELALPVDRQVRFDITSSNMMNSFYAPTMAGMVYAMPGMRSTLHAVLNRPGVTTGMSANYSGAGFSDMKFRLVGLDAAGFARWANAARGSRYALTTANYLKLEKPSEKVATMRFAAVQMGLFDRVVERCVAPGTRCMSETMHHDGGAMPPGRQSEPRGEKPDGALFKDEREIDPVPHRTAPVDKAPPGNAKPGAAKNREMSARPPHPAPPPSADAGGAA